MKKLLFSSFLTATILCAGGKGVVPPQSPIEPIERLQTHSYYAGIGFVRGDYRGCIFPGCKYEDVTFGVVARAGYEWNEYIGLEARMLGTFWGADPFGGQKIAHGGLFAKPMYPLMEDVGIYGLFGYGRIKTTTGGNGNLKTVDEGGFSAGIGVEYDLFSREDIWGVFIDYQRFLLATDMPELDAISIGFTYEF